VTDRAGILRFIVREASRHPEKNGLLLSYFSPHVTAHAEARGPAIRIVRTFSRVLLSAARSPGGLNCLSNEGAWDEALRVLGDAVLLKESAMEQRLRKALFSGDPRRCPAASVAKPEGEPPSIAVLVGALNAPSDAATDFPESADSSPLDKISYTSGRFYNGLAYVLASANQSVRLADSPFSIVGNLYYFRYEDRAQTEAFDRLVAESMVSNLFELGADIGLKVDLGPSASVSFMGYVFNYDEALGREWYIGFNYALADTFTVSLEYHKTKFNGALNEPYDEFRVAGKWIPPIWK